ncbi:hypothetical protein FRC03_000015 [Tulasnella sp. 419]|nr:hypothetical protein FRC03_000015 [Tulasnella sp. 419]
MREAAFRGVSVEGGPLPQPPPTNSGPSLDESLHDPYRVGDFSIANWPVAPHNVLHLDVIRDSYHVRPVPIFGRDLQQLLPTVYEHQIGAVVFLHFNVRLWMIGSGKDRHGVFKAEIKHVQILFEPTTFSLQDLFPQQ